MKATVASFHLLDIHNETKPGIYPGNFSIPKSDGKLPATLVVDNSTGYVYLDHDRGSLRTTIPVEEVANSIVNDFCNSMPGYEPGVASPGLFWVEGQYSPKQIIEKFPVECEQALAKQKNWLISLVKWADDEFARTKQVRAISGLHRRAANFLGLERSWNVETNVENIQKCKSCSSSVPTDIAVCPNCQCVLNEEKYKSLKFAS